MRNTEYTPTPQARTQIQLSKILKKISKRFEFYLKKILLEFGHEDLCLIGALLKKIYIIDLYVDFYHKVLQHFVKKETQLW